MLTPVAESSMESEVEEGLSPRTSEQSEITTSASYVSGFQRASLDGQRTAHRHHSVGEEAVREFIEINQKEASKIEHEQEPGCGIIDFYGYEPRVTRRVYRSWTGCVVSHFSLIAFLLVVCYACWQYWVVPFHVILGETALNPDNQITATSEPSLPKIGLDFRLANGSSFFDPSYLTYAFALKTIYYQDKLPRATVKLNYSRCAFTSADGGPVVATAMCPDESIVVLQGIFSSPVYSYLQLDITPCINSSSSPVVCQSSAAITALLAGGTSVIMGDAANLNLRDVTVPDKLTAVTTYTSFRYDLTPAFYQKVDVLLTPRDITKKSAVVDIDQWREHATDVFFSGVVPTFTDRSAANPLIRYYVRLDTVAQEIELEPYKNFMDLMEMLGSFKALLDLLLGIPLRYLNKWFFLREVKKEVRRGALHTDMLLPNSSQPKPHRLQSIMRHIHTVRQGDSFQRRSAGTLTAFRSSFKKATGGIRRLFSPPPPESPTRIPLRSQRARSASPESPLVGSADHSVWIDPPESGETTRIGRIESGGRRARIRFDLPSRERNSDEVASADPLVLHFGLGTSSGTPSPSVDVLSRSALRERNPAEDGNGKSLPLGRGFTGSLEASPITNPLFNDDESDVRQSRETRGSDDMSMWQVRRSALRSSAPEALLTHGMPADSGIELESERGAGRGLTSGIGQGGSTKIAYVRSSFSGGF
ncbi:hypothetical protein KFL_003510040 [Klebsormidium nitens]|uniref:Uncharacterized protein n=1 Tax=Klebsormidium nitens TaxID=105231 RepID=A0A1Y1I8Z5_KLENI|nr:hypothetical protein KFL_003510040 [Klebsormidium nitens]|eukprot:GAQ87410.1 hypothetical protein KFL_003510040 [Klebsormidium nitens]